MNTAITSKAEQLLFDFHEGLWFEYHHYPLPTEEETIPNLSRFAMSSAGGDIVTYWSIRKEWDLVKKFVNDQITPDEYLEDMQVLKEAMSMHKQ